MRTLYVTEFISLDGVVEAPGGEEGYRHSGWTFDIEEDPARNEFKVEETFATQTLLLGRTTYEGFAAAWPERDGEFADKFNTMEKVVVSTTLNNPTWHNTTRRSRPRRSARPQGGRRRTHRGARQRYARPSPPPLRPGRPVEPHGVPSHSRQRQAALPDRHRGQAEAHPARDPHLHQRHPAQHLRDEVLSRGVRRVRHVAEKRPLWASVPAADKRTLVPRSLRVSSIQECRWRSRSRPRCCALEDGPTKVVLSSADAVRRPRRDAPLAG